MADIKKSSIAGRSTIHLLNVKDPTRTVKRIKLSFQRTRATLNVLKTGKSVDASMGLIDLTETSAGFFTQELLLKGSMVEVCITEPRLLKVKGLVAWSVPMDSGMHDGKFGFRSGMQFVFENEVQRAAVLEYIQKVNTDPLEAMRSGAALPFDSTPLPAAGLAPDPAAVAPAAEAVAPVETPAPDAINAATEAAPTVAEAAAAAAEEPVPVATIEEPKAA